MEEFCNEMESWEENKGGARTGFNVARSSWLHFTNNRVGIFGVTWGGNL